MDAQKIKFMMIIQLEIDKLESKLGSNHQDVIGTKALFQKLSHNEILKKENENKPSEYCDEIHPIKIDTQAIRNHLEIRGNVSIDYDFIKNDRVKKQLIKDNLRMENARLSLTKDELTRFYEFCINAFYQIEELLNYYYHKKFESDRNGLYTFLINNNNHYKILENDDEIMKSAKLKKQSELKNKSLDFITVADKITSFSFGFFDIKSGNYSGSTMNSLRLLRNEDLHRCTVIEKNRTEKLNTFLFYKDYNAIRDAIQNTAQIIKSSCK